MSVNVMRSFWTKERRGLFRRWGAKTIAGVSLLMAGVLLLGASGAYYGYTAWATATMDELVVEAPDETLDPNEGPYASAQLLYPGAFLPARQWADPRSEIHVDGLPDPRAFTPLSPQSQPRLTGPEGRADRIAIPMLGIDATVEELRIVRLENSAAYETPAFTVGHIPVTPNPGSHGNGWYFGHLESPVQNEGNIFARLPRVPDLLREGEDVHVVLTVGEREYLYRVTETNLVHETELALYGSDDARITLVTCYPHLKYDHRLLVTAELAGFRSVQDA